ncbi:hypothetical protein B566_EDAN013930 [Ephemera danica]|nr:hypothetical protein B566_EDAN013930 [Ephemera danica]
MAGMVQTIDDATSTRPTVRRRRMVSCPKCTGADVVQCVHKRVPITSWLPRYSRNDVIPDLIAGITIGLTLIPQSIAYASLAGLEPQYGLYSAFLGSFVYIVFGTVKEVNLGPKALLSLLTFNYTHHLGPQFAVLLCFLCGCLELLCGVLQLGFIVNFVSSPVISGYTWAMVIVIASSQLKGLLGLQFSSESLLETLGGVVTRISDTRTGDATLGFCCCFLLLSMKALRDYVKPKRRVLGKIVWFVSTARNALIVLLCAGLSSVLENSGVEVPYRLTGRITAGLPPFQLPPMSAEIGNRTLGFVEMADELKTGMVAMTVVSIISNLAIGRAFAQGRMLDATQEMITLGLCNIAGSMVGSMPVAGAFSRSAISNASGIMVLLSLSLLTPYFYYIPRATLAAVVACALVSLVDLSVLKPMWKSSKRDVLLLFVTFVASLLWGIDLGLVIGVALDVVLLMIANARPHVQTNCMQLEGIGMSYLLVTPSLGLRFPAIDHVRAAVQEASNKYPLLRYIVLDCAGFAMTDFTAAQSWRETEAIY